MAKKSEKASLTNPIRETRSVPIGDYGFLSDGEVSALVAPAGSVDWMCVPRFDSPSALGSILGRRAGTLFGHAHRNRDTSPSSGLANISERRSG